MLLLALFSGALQQETTALAWISLGALGLVILASCTTKANPGVVAIVLAWIIGVYLAGFWDVSISVREVASGFPSNLFLTLAAVTLLFTQASVNGTLDRVAAVAVRCCRGNVGLMPVMFFLLAAVFAVIGAGNIAASALIAPMAMATAHRAGIPIFLMVIMVGHGAIAGALSPISPTGIIAGSIAENQLLLVEPELGAFKTTIFFHNMVANFAVAAAGYLLFGGWKLFGRRYRDEPGTDETAAERMEPRHWITLSVIATLVVGVIFFDVHVGMGAFAGAVLLTLLGMSDEAEAMKQMPWRVMMMVCGVTVLTSLLEKTGGSALLQELVGAVSGPQTITGVIALVAGVISVYSSTSGVVLPAFLPQVQGFADQVAGADPMAIASSLAVGGHLVDSSPLSTIGALCIACAPVTEDRRILFLKVLAWGLSMSVVGALYCYVFFGLLGTA